MMYSFEFGSKLYTIKNFWFGDISLQVFCDGNEIYRACQNKEWSVSNKYIIDTQEGKLIIEATSKIFSVDFKVLDENNNLITLQESKEPLSKIINRYKLSLELPEKDLSSISLFVIEVAALLLSFWLILVDKDYIEGFILLILSVIGLVKFNIK